MSQYVIYDVSAEFLMDIAKQVASSPHPLTRKAIIGSFKKSTIYVNNAISQCVQLGLLTENKGQLTAGDKYRDLTKRSEKSQLLIVLRQALQNYPPFLIYVDFISKGYSSEDSAWMTSGIFDISSPKDRIEKLFRNWGLQTALIVSDAEGRLTIPEGEKGMPNNYVRDLINALKADLTAKIFLIETMSPNAYKYLTESKIDIDVLADALVNYEHDPKTSANKASQFFENFLFKFGTDVGANVTKGNGTIQYADIIKAEKDPYLLKNQKHLCYGIGSLRNMSHHDPDKETNKSWVFTPQGAIITSLIVPATIRSIYLYWSEQKQEF
jgi:hypothetical protein